MGIVLRNVLGGSLALVVLICHAQSESPIGVRRIGVLASSAVGASDLPQWPTSLLEGLRERGWVEGKNLVVERRVPSEGASADLRLAEELVKAKVDVIVTIGTPAALAARGATSTIPIVMATIGDPVSAGLVTNLSRPGGNITGNTFIESTLR